MNSRKGYIFTTLTLFIIIIVFAAIQFRSDSSEASSPQVRSHIVNANAFLEQLEEDLPRMIAITGYRSLLGLEEYVSTNGAYVQNISDLYIELLVNGSANGTQLDIMNETTITEFTGRLEGIAAQQGITVNISIGNVTFGHQDPFHIQINTTLSLNASTRDAMTNWSYSVPITSVFSIEELKDPIYTVGTLGRVPSVVFISNVSTPYILPNNDSTRLQILWNESFYIPSTTAPSFLMRFSGNLSPSPHGIISLVDTKLLDAQDISVKTDHSVVDFIYFNESSPSVTMIENMSDEFVIDLQHVSVLGLTGFER